MCFVKRAKHHVCALLEKSVLLRREKPRPEDGAERPIAEVEPTCPELIVEMVLAISTHPVGQEIVVGGDAITQRTPPCHPERSEGSALSTGRKADPSLRSG